MSDIKLYQGDCLEVMKDIGNESIDCIITDPPYKTTSRGRGKDSTAEEKNIKEETVNRIQVLRRLHGLF